MAADIALVGRSAAQRGGAGSIGDVVFRALTFLFALLVLLILGGVIVALVEGALPALRTFGLAFPACFSMTARASSPMP